MVVLGCSAVAYAADLGNMPTKAPFAPPGPTTCTSIQDFFTTACQLSRYGVRFYGTIDTGAGYQTNGTRFAPDSGAGVNYSRGRAASAGSGSLPPVHSAGRTSAFRSK